MNFKKIVFLFFTLFIYFSVIADHVLASGDFEKDFMFAYNGKGVPHATKMENTRQKKSFLHNIFNYSELIFNQNKQQPIRSTFLSRIINGFSFTLTNYYSSSVVLADSHTDKKDEGFHPSEIRPSEERGSRNTSISSVPETKRILVIDGGGIRGVIPAYILVKMEEDLKDSLGREVRIAECFDLIVGTSTGGIIALGLNVPDGNLFSRPKYKASDILRLYRENGKTIFPHTGFYERVVNYVAPKYDADPLKNILHEYFGGHKLTDSISNVMITSYNVRADQPYLFTNYDRPTISKKRILSENFFMKDVARATSAAPTYFEGVEIWDCAGIPRAYIDGGVANNNPTVTALLEARESFGREVNFTIISLGTGEAAAENFRPATKDAGKVQWASIIPEIMMNGAAKLAKANMEKLIKEFSNGVYKVKDIRFQPFLRFEDMILDNADDENIKKLIEEADKEYESKREKFKQEFIIPFKEEEDLRKKQLEQRKSSSHQGKYELAMFELKRYQGSSEKIKEGKKLLRDAAEGGNIDASYVLAQILEDEFNKNVAAKQEKWHEQFILDKFKGDLDNKVFLSDESTLHDLANSALTFYNKATRNPEFQYSLEAKYKSARLYNEAIRKLGYPLDQSGDDKNVLRRIADIGHAEAEFEYAMHLLNLLEKKDKPEKISYHSQISYDGKIITYNDAITYLKRSSSKDFAKAQYQLALIYEIRREDAKTIKQLYGNAAYQGYTPAKYQLAKIYESENKDQEFKELVFDSARDGYSKAILEVGSYYEKQSKLEEAEKWYTRLIAKKEETQSDNQLEDKDRSEAQYRLAKVYQKKGMNVEYWARLEEAAKNHKDAAYEMGELYYETSKWGVPGWRYQDKDKLIKARDWYEAAANKGHKGAREKFEKVRDELGKL